MKAAIFTKYGPPNVLHIADVPKPVSLADEVLIKIHAATYNRTDAGLRSAKYVVSRFVTGLFKPSRSIGGSEFAGEVVEVGSAVTDYHVGDRVFVFEDVRGGGHAEFATVPQSGSMAKIPDTLDYQHAAASGEGATYALSALKIAQVKPGDQVMVYGATGSIGVAGMQIANHLGATVTAVCGSRNVELVKSLGADTVTAYDTQDFTQTSTKFDLVFDAVGKSSYGACKPLLKPKGSYCSSELGPRGENIPLALWSAISGSRRVLFPYPRINRAAMNEIRDMIEAGDIKPVIDRAYTLDQITDAATYVESERKTGSVIIEIK